MLAPLVLLAVAPKVGTTISYDFRAGGLDANGPSLQVRVTERIDAVRPDGTIEASREYADVRASGDAEAMRGVESIAGKRDRYLLGPTREWRPATQNTELGFPDFPLPVGRVPVGHVWDPGGFPRGVQVRLKATRTIAGHSAAVLDFPARPNRKGKEGLGPGSHWVLDLADGRPLFARLEMIEDDPAHSGVFTLVRRDVPGLVPRL